MEEAVKYAEVIVDISSPNLDKTFTYSIPPEIEEEITPGTPVMIPFGKSNKLKKGYVVGITSFCSSRYQIKAIDSVVKKGLAIEDEFMALAYKMKSYYGGMLKDSLRTVIPVKQSVNKNRAKVKKDAFPEITGLQEEFPEGNGEICKLNEEQQSIRNRICRDFDNGVQKKYLLHGVTGSGKTEVYIDVIRHVVEQGKEVIVLIPEISLTYQTVRRFALCFGNKVAFSHSKLSKGERYIQSENAKAGLIQIMIGPRSALFTPFKNLGLIIIDEEHEASYKSETTPKYHARDVAEWRAELCGASLLLGTATPSLESYTKAINGEYELLVLEKRAKDAVMPEAHIVDLRQELKEGNRKPISRLLWTKINDRLEKKQQIMLFVNRRGYAGFMSCRSCGYVPKCPHCDISLTLHNNDRLYCHYCGYNTEKPVRCPKCGSKYIAGFGTGTQKIEAIVKEAFPQAGVLRMDADTTTGKGDYEKILSSFRRGEADILIGTQMIVKGHDFPKVTLVGILAADLSLYTGDYRATERTFQLLAQASGRAGRGEEPGEVVIQTYNPEHYCVQTAAEGNYRDFYFQEIVYRKLLGYPPSGNMCVVFVQAKTEEAGKDVCDKLIFAINSYSRKTNQSFHIIGPAPAGIKKINDVFRYVIYIKDKDYLKLVGLKDGLEYFINNQNLKDAIVQFDFNPMSGY
ncbi:MAG: primosomal protein N' [Lachnospiraceae bacterium]